jgi:hypothetical protein
MLVRHVMSSLPTDTANCAVTHSVNMREKG